jgi:hypothetical protein
MIDISLLKTIVRGRIKGSGPDWDTIFFISINDVLDELSRRAAVETERIDLDDPPDEIDLDSKWEHVLRDGVPFYMQKNAFWARQGDDVVKTEYELAMARAMGDAIQDRWDEEEAEEEE